MGMLDELCHFLHKRLCLDEDQVWQHRAVVEDRVEMNKVV